MKTTVRSRVKQLVIALNREADAVFSPWPKHATIALGVVSIALAPTVEAGLKWPAYLAGATVAAAGMLARRSRKVHTRFALRPAKLLRLFRWLLPRDAREEIDIIEADLREDAKEMRAARRSRWLILGVQSWHVAKTIGAFARDGAFRTLAKLLPLALLLKMLGR